MIEKPPQEIEKDPSAKGATNALEPTEEYKEASTLGSLIGEEMTQQLNDMPTKKFEEPAPEQQKNKNKERAEKKDWKPITKQEKELVRELQKTNGVVPSKKIPITKEAPSATPVKRPVAQVGDGVRPPQKSPASSTGKSGEKGTRRTSKLSRNQQQYDAVARSKSGNNHAVQSKRGGAGNVASDSEPAYETPLVIDRSKLPMKDLEQNGKELGSEETERLEQGAQQSLAEWMKGKQSAELHGEDNMPAQEEVAESVEQPMQQEEQERLKQPEEGYEKDRTAFEEAYERRTLENADEVITQHDALQEKEEQLQQVRETGRMSEEMEQEQVEHEFTPEPEQETDEQEEAPAPVITEETKEQQEAVAAFQDLRDRYRVHKMEVRDAKEQYYAAYRAHEEAKAENGLIGKFLPLGDSVERKKAKEAAEAAYHALLDQTPEIRNQRFEAFKKMRLSEESHEGRMKKKVASWYEAVLTAQATKNNKDITLIEQGAKGREESTSRFWKCSKETYNWYSKLPLKKKMLVGLGVSVPLASTAAAFGGASALFVAGAGATAAVRRAVGMYAGVTVGAQGFTATKHGIDTYADERKERIKSEQKADRDIMGEHEVAPSVALKQVYKLEKQTKHIKTGGTVAGATVAGAVGYAAGSGAAHAAGSALDSADAVSVVDVTEQPEAGEVGVNDESPTEMKDTQQQAAEEQTRSRRPWRENMQRSMGIETDQTGKGVQESAGVELYGSEYEIKRDIGKLVKEFRADPHVDEADTAKIDVIIDRIEASDFAETRSEALLKAVEQLPTEKMDSSVLLEHFRNELLAETSRAEFIDQVFDNQRAIETMRETLAGYEADYPTTMEDDSYVGEMRVFDDPAIQEKYDALSREIADTQRENAALMNVTFESNPDVDIEYSEHEYTEKSTEELTQHLGVMMTSEEHHALVAYLGHEPTMNSIGAMHKWIHEQLPTLRYGADAQDAAAVVEGAEVHDAPIDVQEAATGYEATGTVGDIADLTNELLDNDEDTVREQLSSDTLKMVEHASSEDELIRAQQRNDFLKQTQDNNLAEARSRSEVLAQGTTNDKVAAIAEVQPSKEVHLAGNYEAGESVERVLQHHLEEEYPDLTKEEYGKVAHRIRLALMGSPDNANAFNIHGSWDNVMKGERYDITLNRAFIEQQIEQLQSKPRAPKLAAAEVEPLPSQQKANMIEVQPQSSETLHIVGEPTVPADSEQGEMLAEQTSGINDALLNEQNAAFENTEVQDFDTETLARAHEIIERDLHQLYGSDGLFGSKALGVKGVESVDWRDIQSRTVEELLAKKDFPERNAWLEPVESTGFDSGEAVGKMQAYIKELMTQSDVKPNTGESVTEYLHRAAAQAVHDKAMLPDAENIELKTGGTETDREIPISSEQERVPQYTYRPDDFPQANTENMVDADLKAAAEAFGIYESTSLDAIRNLFKEGDIFGKALTGQKAIILNNWGPIGETPVELLTDNESGIHYMSATDKAVTLTPDTERLLRSIMNQTGRAAERQGIDLQSLVGELKETYPEKSVTLGQVMSRFSEALEEKRSAVQVATRSAGAIETVPTDVSEGMHDGEEYAERKPLEQEPQRQTVHNKTPESIQTIPPLEAEAAIAGEVDLPGPDESKGMFGGRIRFGFGGSEELKPAKLGNIQMRDVFLDVPHTWDAYEGTVGELYNDAENTDFRQHVNRKLKLIGLSDGKDDRYYTLSSNEFQMKPKQLLQALEQKLHDLTHEKPKSDTIFSHKSTRRIWNRK